MDAKLEAIAGGLRRVVRDVLVDDRLRLQVETKADGSLVTAADRQLQAAIRQWLEVYQAGVPVLAEERSRASNQAIIDQRPARMWVLDPLDGTTNLASGIPYTAVSLALLEAGEPELGVVYDPDRDELFCARRGGGAWCNGRPLSLPADRGITQLKECVALVDFKRLPAGLSGALAAQHPFRSQRNFGSVALDWCWLAAGRGQLYLHGNANLWDYAAGWLIATEAGVVAQTLDGQEVFTLALEKRSALAAASHELFAQWREWIQLSL